MSLPAPPILSNPILSGAPLRLADVAQESKERFYKNRTIRDDLPRMTDADTELPVLPPDTTRDAFNKAIQELKDSLGDENVVLNDGPLIDGWYLEHP